MCENELFQNLGTKTELHAKFRDKNNNLTEKKKDNFEDF